MSVIDIGKNTHRVIPFLWAGENSEIDYQIQLTQPGASVYFVGLLLGKHAEIGQFNILVRHLAPHTTSKIIIKSALYDQAHIDINGLVEIEPGAHGTDAWLAAHILLLSNQAKGQAVPSLEIRENDVKAGHATTIGRVNEELLFYLTSRGISKNDAKQIVVSGFLSSAIDLLPKDMAQRANKILTS